jgi:hypothetical protein
MAGIGKLDAARQQLDCAIRLLDSEDLAAHTLAFAAYGLLRDLLGHGPDMEVLLRLEKRVKLRNVPEFLKHGKHDPEAILREHSHETAHLTITLAIRLWEEHGQELTPAMQNFGKRPDPYKPGHRHSAAVETVRQGGPLAELENIVTKPSTASSGAIIPGARRRRKYD